MRALEQSGYGQRILTILDADDQVLCFRIQRDSMLNYGEVIAARITKKNTTLRGYFAETAKNLTAFIPTSDSYREGERVQIQITKEARLGKEATARIVSDDVPSSVPDITRHLPFEVNEIVPDVENRTDSLIAEALETRILFAKGAELHIERTQSCWCFDVDSAGSTLPLTEINKQACALIQRQVFLKNPAGMIVIDFAGFKKFSEQKRLFQEMKELFKTDEKTTVYGFTKMGLFELQRKRTTAALVDLFLLPTGEKHPAAVASALMRDILHCKQGNLTVILNSALLPWLPENIYTYCAIETDSTYPVDIYELKGK